MLAIAVGEDEARELIPIGADVQIAAINAHNSVTLAGNNNNNDNITTIATVTTI